MEPNSDTNWQIAFGGSSWPPEGSQSPSETKGSYFSFDVFKTKGVQKGSLGGPNEFLGANKRPFWQKSRARATFSFYFLAVLLRVAFLIAFCSNIRRTFNANCLFFLVVFLRRSLVKNLCFCMPSPRRFLHLLAFLKTWRPSRYIVFHGVFYNFPFFFFFFWKAKTTNLSNMASWKNSKNH